MWATTLWNHPHPQVQWTVVIGASLAAAVWDMNSRRIPNLLTLPLLACGLAWSAWIGGASGLADAAGAVALLAFPYVFLFLYGGGGAGDAKLMGALGAWLGLVNGAAALVSVLISGIVLAVSFSVSKGRLRDVLRNISLALREVVWYIIMVIVQGRRRAAPPSLPKTQDMLTIPYGVSIFAGVCIAAAGVRIWRG